MDVKEFLNKYDRGEKFSDREKQELIWDWPEVDRIEGDSGRGDKSVAVVIDAGDRYFMIDYQEGLTEYQENYYSDGEVVEVEPYEETIVIKKWKPKK